jgi:hypothetical protein
MMDESPYILIPAGSVYVNRRSGNRVRVLTRYEGPVSNIRRLRVVRVGADGLVPVGARVSTRTVARFLATHGVL